MRFLNAQPLRRQIVVATCALLLILAGAIAWSATRTRAEREDEVRQETISVARLAAAYLNQYFDALDAMAAVLVRHPAIAAFNRTEAEKLFANLVREQPLLLAAVLRDRNGALVASGADVVANRQGAQPPAYLMEVLRTGRPAVSELYDGPITGRPAIGQAYPVRSEDGTIQGVMAFSLNLVELQQLFESLALPGGSVVTLLDQHGRVVARTGGGAGYLGAVLEPHPSGAAGAPVLRKDVDGVERFVGTISLDRAPWSLSVGIPRTVVASRLTPLWWRTLVISGAAVLAVLGLALWVSHHTSHGLHRLRSAAQRIAEGDLSPPARAAAPNLEIAQLQEAFITMAANLLATHEALDRQVEQERKTHEMLQSLQRQVVRQERLAAVGVLVSGVAHELNNPLQAILGTAELIERYPSATPDILEEIGVLKTQASRAREIIRNLSRFGSQQQPGPPALVDLHSVIAEVVQLRRHDLDKLGISIDVEAAEAASQVWANVTELEQVTLNFVINAQQAIESAGRQRGRILIRVVNDRRKVRLEVQDDGPGIAPENEAKLFQPFFTTKPVGEGTGLGLSVSYGIIDSYGGVIGCRTNIWHGATFFFELPAAGAPTDKPAAIAIL